MPAAGAATRLAPYPGAKELLPVAFRREAGGVLPVSVLEHTLERLAAVHMASTATSADTLTSGWSERLSRASVAGHSTQPSHKTYCRTTVQK